MLQASPDSLRGRTVCFRVSDTHVPEPSVLLHDLHGGDVLEGKVVGLSDNGREGGAFVVVEVAGLQQPCILAVERILRAL